MKNFFATHVKTQKCAQILSHVLVYQSGISICYRQCVKLFTNDFMHFLECLIYFNEGNMYTVSLLTLPIHIEHTMSL